MKKRISDELRSKIRKEVASGKKAKDLAERYSVSTWTIWNICKETEQTEEEVEESEEEIESEDPEEYDWESWASFWKEKYLEAHAKLLELGHS